MILDSISICNINEEHKNRQLTCFIKPSSKLVLSRASGVVLAVVGAHRDIQRQLLDSNECDKDIHVPYRVDWNQCGDPHFYLAPSSALNLYLCSTLIYTLWQILTKLMTCTLCSVPVSKCQYVIKTNETLITC